MADPRTVYFVPAGPTELGGRLFEPQPPIAPLAPLGGDFLDFFRDKGVAVRTIDAWSPDNHDPEDAVVFINHPEDDLWHSLFYFLKYTLRGRERYAVSRSRFALIARTFSKKILFQGEPPTNSPYPHTHLARLKRIYSTIFLYRKPEVSDPQIRFLMWPRDYREEFPKYFEEPKEKFLVMMNNNVRPHAFPDKELYSERLRAIKYWSERADFDLFGGRWERRPFFPYGGYRRYIRKCWRGYVNSDKIPALAPYRFCLAFENSTYPGYVSEKIFDSFLAGCIPIYLGAPDIAEYVPTDCFIDMRRFTGYAELESHLRSLTPTDRSAYLKRISAYLLSQKDGIFSKRRFAQALWDAITE